MVSPDRDPLAVTAQPRPVPAEVQDDTPLVAVAWRIMAQAARALERCRKRIDEQREHAETPWILLADEAHRIRKTQERLGELLSELGHELVSTIILDSITVNEG